MVRERHLSVCVIDQCLYGGMEVSLREWVWMAVWMGRRSRTRAFPERSAAGISERREKQGMRLFIR